VNLATLTGGVSIGNDASGDFKLSITGIAVRTCDGSYVANDGRQMVDVTDLVIDGSENYVYRVPTIGVDPGDLIVTSDAPLATLFVQDLREDGTIRGIDPRTNRLQVYVQPTNILNSAFFVKVIGVSNIHRRRENDDLSALLTLMVLSGDSQGFGADNPQAALLLLLALTRNRDRDDILPLLIAMGGAQMGGAQMGGTQGNVLPLLLLASSGRGSAIFREIEGREREEEEEEEARRDWAGLSELHSITGSLARMEEALVALAAQKTEKPAESGTTARRPATRG